MTRNAKTMKPVSSEQLGSPDYWCYLPQQVSCVHRYHMAIWACSVDVARAYIALIRLTADYILNADR